MQGVVFWVLHWQNNWMHVGSPHCFPAGCDELKGCFGVCVCFCCVWTKRDEAKLEDLGEQVGPGWYMLQMEN